MLAPVREISAIAAPAGRSRQPFCLAISIAIWTIESGMACVKAALIG